MTSEASRLAPLVALLALAACLPAPKAGPAGELSGRYAFAPQAAWVSLDPVSHGDFGQLTFLVYRTGVSCEQQGEVPAGTIFYASFSAPLADWNGRRILSQGNDPFTINAGFMVPDPREHDPDKARAGWAAVSENDGGVARLTFELEFDRGPPLSGTVLARHCPRH